MKRAVAILLVLVLAGVALEGGTYGTRDLLRLKGQVRDEQAKIAALRHQVDSLSRYDRALKTDNDTIERIAREMYGMIKPGEHLYQVVRDTSKR